MLHLYIGNGKGKTTAAIGLVVRAKGAGKKVCFVQFLKGGCASSEIKPLKKLGIRFIRFSHRHPVFYKKISVSNLKTKISKDLESVKKILSKYNMVVLDEILTALRHKFATEKEVLSIIASRPEKTELVLTGVSAPARIRKLADYISYIKKLKHPFDRGAMARKGIEM